MAVVTICLSEIEPKLSLMNGSHGIVPFRYGFLRESRVRHPDDENVQHYSVLEAHLSEIL